MKTRKNKTEIRVTSGMINRRILKHTPSSMSLYSSNQLNYSTGHFPKGRYFDGDTNGGVYFVTSLNSPNNVMQIKQEAMEERNQEDNKKKKNKQIGCGDMYLVRNAEEYCQSTTLHGLKYLGDRNLHFLERAFWAIAFFCGVIAAFYFISTLYQKWDESPMIITISPKATHIETIPFPAVTICNMNVARKSVAREIEKASEYDPEASVEKLLLRDFCNINDSADGEHPETMKTGNWSLIKKFMIKVTQPCHEMLLSCKWHGVPHSCQDLFNAELTDEGICCSFNKVYKDYIFRNPRQSLDLNQTFPYPKYDWTPESGYSDDVPTTGVPWRAYGAGRSLGLTVVLDVESDEYYCSSTASVGFKVLLHNPIESPKIADYAYLITPGRETRMAVEPVISSSTRSLVNVARNKRECIFASDRYLRFYRTYTQRNCEMECQSNFTLQQCKCVPYYLPKDTETRICGKKDEACFTKARNVMEYKLKDDNLDLPAGWNSSETVDCSCLPGCFRIQYAKSISSSNMGSHFKIKPEYIMDKDVDYYQKNMAVLHVFFNENEFTGMEKGEIFGFTEFLSSTGGLLGLFLGFSFMSAAEVIYFLTLRLIFSLKREKNEKAFEARNDKRLPYQE